MKINIYQNIESKFYHAYGLKITNKQKKILITKIEAQ